MTAVIAYVALGSNLAQPERQVRQAAVALGALPETALRLISPLYRTAPMGPPGQPDYVNAVAALQTTLAPLALLDELQAIEQTQGRVREGERWGPRTLDLDLLLYGDTTIADERLTVPHPGLKERSFVVVPLHDIAPDLVLPDGTALAQLRRLFTTPERLVPAG